VAVIDLTWDPFTSRAHRSVSLSSFKTQMLFNFRRLIVAVFFFLECMCETYSSAVARSVVLIIEMVDVRACAQFNLRFFVMRAFD
jgi:hypothetical protein